MKKEGLTLLEKMQIDFRNSIRFMIINWYLAVTIHPFPSCSPTTGRKLPGV